MKKPTLIDSALGLLQSTQRNTHDGWYCAKDEADLSTIDRLYHAWLVLTDKARAYRFKEDDPAPIERDEPAKDFFVELPAKYTRVMDDNFMELTDAKPFTPDIESDRPDIEGWLNAVNNLRGDYKKPTTDAVSIARYAQRLEREAEETNREIGAMQDALDNVQGEANLEQIVSLTAENERLEKELKISRYQFDHVKGERGEAYRKLDDQNAKGGIS